MGGDLTGEALFCMGPTIREHLRLHGGMLIGRLYRGLVFSASIQGDRVLGHMGCFKLKDWSPKGVGGGVGLLKDLRAG